MVSDNGAAPRESTDARGAEGGDAEVDPAKMNGHAENGAAPGANGARRNGSAQSNGSSEQAGCAREPGEARGAAKRFDALLNDAMVLLGHAAERGIPVDDDTTRAVLTAAARPGADWPMPVARDLIVAKTALARQLAPVSATSLKNCERDGGAALGRLRRWAVVLALIILPISVVTFVSSGISDEIRRGIEEGSRLELALLKDSHVPDWQMLVQQLRTTNLAIETRTRQLHWFAPFSMTEAPLPKSETGTSETPTQTQISAPPPTTSTQPPISNEGLAQINKQTEEYAKVRTKAQGVLDLVSLLWGAVNTCLLPVLYALLGAAACLLLTVSEELRARTYTRADAATERFVIAAIAGGVVGLFHNFAIAETPSVSPLAIAFLVGYSVEVFFSFLKTVVETFGRGSRAGASEKQAGASRPEPTEAERPKRQPADLAGERTGSSPSLTPPRRISDTLR